MIELITGAPTYAWPFLATLILVGLRSTKTRWISPLYLTVLPATFLTLSYFSTPFPTIFWIFFTACGIGLGFLMIKPLTIRLDKSKRRMEIPGSWVNLGMSLSIFVIRYYLGVIYALFPHMIGSWPLTTLEVAACVISGMFLGRLIGFFQKYANSEHVLS